MTSAGGAAASLTINLGALAANYRQLRDHLRAGAECAAVVKADAYGLGLAPVATRLAQEGCAHFFVATLEEGTALQDDLRGVGAEPTDLQYDIGSREHVAA